VVPQSGGRLHDDRNLRRSVSASGIRFGLDTLDEPVLIEALRYWQKIGLNGIPSRRAIDAVELGAKVLPHVFLADVIPEEPRFIFRLAGTAIETKFGRLKGKSLDDLHLGTELPQIKSQYSDAVSERAPIYCVHHFVTQEGKQRNYKRLVMPLCTDSKKIDGLFGVLIFSPFH
jgi:hypothetical protein